MSLALEPMSGTSRIWTYMQRYLIEISRPHLATVHVKPISKRCVRGPYDVTYNSCCKHGGIYFQKNKCLWRHLRRKVSTCHYRFPCLYFAKCRLTVNTLIGSCVALAFVQKVGLSVPSSGTSEQNSRSKGFWRRYSTFKIRFFLSFALGKRIRFISQFIKVRRLLLSRAQQALRPWIVLRLLR